MLFEDFYLLAILFLLMLMVAFLVYRKDAIDLLVQEAEAKSKKAIQQERIFEAISILKKCLEQLDQGSPLSPSYPKRQKAKKKIQAKIKYLAGEFSEDPQSKQPQKEKGHKS